MADRRHWLTPLLIVMLVACGQRAAPTATPPGATAAVPLVPLASPTSASGVPRATEAASPVIAPTRPASVPLPTATVASAGDARYVDPQGRFSITIPREWQSRLPTNAAGNALVSFDAPDGAAGLAIGLAPISLGTTAKEFAANAEKASAGAVTNYKKQGQESLTVANVPAEALTYQGAMGNKEYLFRQVLLAQGVDGWSITFPLDPAARQRYGPLVDAITQSFAFGTPIGKIPVPTADAATKPAGGSAVTGIPAGAMPFPGSALDWKADTPVAAGVPVRLADAGLIAQLNGATFTTKASGRATLGADEQFLIADIAIWNTGPTDLLPMPDQCSVSREHGATAAPESVEVAADVAGTKVPPLGKAKIPPGTGLRGTLVMRVPKQPGLLIIRYQPGTARPPQPLLFYVKQ